MFVRKNRNRSGTISVQIISKQGGCYRVAQTVGSSRYPEEGERLVLQAHSIIANPGGQLKLFSTKSQEALFVEIFVKNLSNAQIYTVGPDLIFGTLFDRIGFNASNSDLFRHIR